MSFKYKKLSKRAVEQELMDDFTLGGAELSEALRELRRLNRLFAAAPATLYGIVKLWKEAAKPQRLSILDIGCGSGDVNRRLLQWADANRIDVTITLVDITAEACEEATQLFRDEPRINVQQSDLFELPERTVDIVTGTQFLHHFNEQELQPVILKMLAIARHGVVINDIHRHWLAWAAVWLTARLLTNNRYIHNDGPLSVAKGFQADDWERMKHSLGEHAELSYSWRPLFRYAAVVRRKRQDSPGKSLL